MGSRFSGRGASTGHDGERPVNEAQRVLGGSR